MHRCSTFAFRWATAAAVLNGLMWITCQPIVGQAADGDSEAKQVTELYRAQVFRSDDGATLPYRILTPGNPDAETKYPLVLFLHGAGERGDDNAKQLVHGAVDFADNSRREKHPAFVVFPQCPTGSQWVDVPWNEITGGGTFSESPSEPMKLALQLVESLKLRFPIDPDRVYVVGLSMGGYGTWYAAGRYPDRFAAAIAVCGGSDPEWAPRYQGVPVWAFHGDKDTAVPVVRSREMVSALALVGHKPELRYTEYEGVGHNSWTETFARDDVHSWLFRQRRLSKKQ